MAQSVKPPASVQVMISMSVGLSPTLSSVLTGEAWSLLQILCLSFCPFLLMLMLMLSLSFSLSLSLKNK